MLHRDIKKNHLFLYNMCTNPEYILALFAFYVQQTKTNNF